MQADADLPVEAEGRNGGLDEVANAADDTVGQLGRGVGAACGVNDGQMRQDPEGKRDGENDGAGLAQEDAGAIYEAQGRATAAWACDTAAARG